MVMPADTIYALASARGRGGVAVVRISGPLAHLAVGRFCRLPAARVASLRWLEIESERIDQALVLIFEEGASFTGEASAELHLHGSPAVVSRVLAALGGIPGLRLAEAGEFTRRAMENGNLDLTQVEGLADLIDAETEAQRKQAVAVLSGALGKVVEGWRARLVQAVALIEAMIDFADEDIPDNLLPQVEALVSVVFREIEQQIAGSDVGEAIRDGFEVAVIGAPNSGKSTLLNAIAKRDVAITSEIAGTTRDVIEVRMDVSGYAVTFLDTAGLHDTLDRIEGMGIQRAIDRAESADVRVFLLSYPGENLPIEPRNGDIVLLGKCDVHDWGLPGISGKTGAGLDELMVRLVAELNGRAAKAMLFTRVRHREALSKAVAALHPLQKHRLQGLTYEIIAFHLRAAMQALEVLLGRVGVEDVLADIYSRFCVGK
jgi:tRNA modification GTPase